MKVYTKRLKDSHHFVTIEEKHRVLIMQRRYEISDEQWERIKEMFPRAKTGRPGKDSRLIFNAILWIVCSGAPWRNLPERFGSWKTVYSRFCKWRDEGTLFRVFEDLKKDSDY